MWKPLHLQSLIPFAGFSLETWIVGIVSLLEILLINQIKVYIELKTNYKILVRFRVASRIDNHSFDLRRFSGMYVLREFVYMRYAFLRTMSEVEYLLCCVANARIHRTADEKKETNHHHQ